MPHTQLVNRQYCLNCYWRDLLELGTLTSDDTRVHFINHFSGCQMCTQQNKNDDYKECESEYVKSYEYADSQLKTAVVCYFFFFFFFFGRVVLSRSRSFTHLDEKKMKKLFRSAAPLVTSPTTSPWPSATTARRTRTHRSAPRRSRPLPSGRRRARPRRRPSTAAAARTRRTVQRAPATTEEKFFFRFFWLPFRKQ